MTKTFEDKFPELKDKIMKVSADAKFLGIDFIKEDTHLPLKIWKEYVPRFEVEWNCLSKKRVREVIEKFRKYSPTIIDDLSEELSLDSETSSKANKEVKP